MKLFSKPSLIILLITTLTACAGYNKESRDMAARQHIAETYGYQYFGQVEQIQYWFNVRKGEKKVSRFWIWEPRTDKVIFQGMTDMQSVTYHRSEIDSTASKKLNNIDAWFINDNYWLLFPFHVAWDVQAKVEDIGRQELPMGDGKAGCVVVTYPAGGGYTPGDVYELYLDEQHRLIQWVYRRGGSDKPTRITTWENNRRVGPLVVSLNHQGEGKNFRVWFTNVGAKLIGVDGWMFAE